MKDRSVEYPNRYQLTQIAGTDNIYDVVPAPGEVTEEGTLINKGTLLSDMTAEKLGFAPTDDPTVDDALRVVPNLSRIQQTLPVADGVTVTAGDVVDVVDGQATLGTIGVEKTLELLPQISGQYKAPTICILNDTRAIASVAMDTGDLKIFLFDISAENPILLDTETIAKASVLNAAVRCADMVVINQTSALYCVSGYYETKAATITVSNDLISVNPFTAIPDVARCVIIKIQMVSETKGIVFGGCDDNVRKIYYCLLSISGQAVSAEEVKVLSNFSIYENYAVQSLKLSEDKAVFGFYADGGTWYAYTMVVTILGNAITLGTPKPFYEAQNLILVPVSESSFLIGAGPNGETATSYWAKTAVSESVITYGSTSSVSLAYGMCKSAYLEDGTIYIYHTISSNKQFGVSTVLFDGTTFTAGVYEKKFVGEVVNDLACRQGVALQGDRAFIVHLGNSGGDARMCADMLHVTSTDALALTSGSAGQNVNIAYDGTFDLVGATGGENIYDGNGEVIAHCPVDGKVDVIGKWKRGKPYVTGTYTGDGTAERTIELGFTPSAVLVDSNPLTYSDKDNRFVFATYLLKSTNYASTTNFNQLEIVENGFTVYFNNGSKTNNATMQRYIAFK